MYTQCEQCFALLEVKAAELSVAQGHLRCARCGTVFDGLQRLRDGVPTSEQLRLKAHPGDGQPPTMQPWEQLDETDMSSTEDMFVVDPMELDEAPVEASEDVHSIPGFAARNPRPVARRSSGWGWLAASVLLCLTLTGQLVYANRNTLAADPRYADWMEMACAYITCAQGPTRNLEAIRIAASNIAEHPSARDALMISATLVNQSDQSVAYPTLEISLSDLSGETIALRRFAPDQYLEEGANIEQGMQPGNLVPVVFEAANVQAMAYEFNIR